MSQNKKQEHHLRFYKLLAQSTGLFVCMFFLFFLIGEGIPDIVKGDGEELIPFIPFLLVPVLGYIVAWFRETTGVAMMVTGAIALFIYLFIKNDIKAALIYSLPFLISAALFYLHMYKKSQLQHKKTVK